MKLPVQVSFHNTPHSEAIEDLIRERASMLDEFSDQITSCRVVVDVPHRHHEHGNLYQVRVDVTAPGEEIVATCESGRRTAYKDIHVAIRDSFDATVRQVEDYVRRRRGAVKTHEAGPHARVAVLFAEQGYGFISTPDGRELYFNRRAVLAPGFARLAVGTEVTFVEEEGEKGPQASTVRIVGRHHHL